MLGVLGVVNVRLGLARRLSLSTSSKADIP